MFIGDIYKIMIETGISYREMAKNIEPKMSHVGLYYHVTKYCKKMKLKRPLAKSGVKEKETKFTLKNNLTKL